MTSAAAMLASMEARSFDFDTKLPPFVGLFYGEPGEGKTTFAMQLAQRITPTDKDILFIDAANGWTSLKSFPELTKRTIGFKFDSVENLMILSQIIAAKVGKYANVGTIVFDEHSAINHIDLDQIVSTRSESPGKQHEDAAGIQDYGITQNRMRKMFNKFIQLTDVRIICLSHVTREKDKDDSLTYVAAGFTPAVRKDLDKIFQIIAYMTTVKRVDVASNTVQYERVMQLHPANRIIAKSRQGFRLKESPDFVIDRIEDWLTGKWNNTDSTLSNTIKTNSDYQGIEVD